MVQFIENNLGVLISFVTLFISGIAAFVTLQATVKQQTEELAVHRKRSDKFHTDLETHIRNTDAHVNQLYMRERDNKIDRLEHTVAAGFDKLETKFDQEIDRVISLFRNGKT